MKLSTTLFAILLFFLFSTPLFSQQYNRSYDESYYASSIPSYTEEDIKQRLNNMPLCIPPKYTSAVRSYVKTYMVRKRAKAEYILGQSLVYFPLYEMYLAEANMPQDLKYLSVLESALNPQATSRSNAAGLWQFMEATGKEYGLAVNRTVDERRDPHKSTKAALTYLKKLYNRYGDWALAIAAYNGGPGRVNRAIKRGRSRNFWRIQKYLPKETQNYVPAFFGAAYLMNYYQQHNISPLYPDLDTQITDYTKIYNSMTFEDISKITGIPTHKIETLNPSYKKRYIPASYTGNYLILPKRVMPAFRQHQQRPDSNPINHYAVPVSTSNNNFFKTSYQVKHGESIYQIARMFGCNAYHVQGWNQLTSMHVTAGQNLTLYQAIITSGVPVEGVHTSAAPVAVRQPTPAPAPVVLRKYAVKPVASVAIKEVENEEEKPMERSLDNLQFERYIYHRMLRGESLADVAKKTDISLQELMLMNNLSRKNKPKTGDRIKLKRR